jgi:hypothetical protein
MRSLWNRASIGWCRTFHPGFFWPVHGHYRCRTCLRIYRVPWPAADGDALRELSGTGPDDRRRGLAFAFQNDRAESRHSPSAHIPTPLFDRLPAETSLQGLNNGVSRSCCWHEECSA